MPLLKPSTVKAVTKSALWHPVVALSGAFLLFNGALAYDAAVKSDTAVKGFSQLLFVSQLVIGAFLVWSHGTPKVVRRLVTKTWNTVVNEKTMFYVGAGAIIANGGFALDAAINTESETKNMAIMMAVLQILGGVALGGYGVYVARK